jgi:hypothetical protein
MENIYNFETEKRIQFLKKKIIRFVNVKTDPRLGVQYVTTSFKLSSQTC